MSSARQYEKLFTVFTPTFNRAEVLPRVYECLLLQTFKDFEWLIVDDGSTDTTSSLVRSWISDSLSWFPIRIIHQRNQHKKVAHNRAIQEANGELFLTLDSDDECTPNALERLAHHWFSIPNHERSKYSAVTVLCMDEYGEVIGDYFPCRTFIDSNPLDMYFKHKVRGEKWGFQRTDILLQYPFSENAARVPGYVPEGMIWMSIARKYKSRYVNEILRTYWRHDKVISCRVTGKGEYKKNAAGALLYKVEFLSKNADYVWSSPLIFIKEGAGVIRSYLHCPSDYRLRLLPESHLGKIIVFVAAPLGTFLYLKDLWNQWFGNVTDSH